MANPKLILAFCGGASLFRNSDPLMAAIRTEFNNPYNHIIYVKRGMDTIFGGGEAEKETYIQSEIEYNYNIGDIVVLIGKSYGINIVNTVAENLKGIIDINLLVGVDGTNAKIHWFGHKYWGRKEIKVPSNVKKVMSFFETKDDSRVFTDKRHRPLVAEDSSKTLVLAEKLINEDHYGISRNKKSIDYIVLNVRSEIYDAIE